MEPLSSSGNGNGNESGGASSGGGQANQPQLDYMRNNRPQRATPRQIPQTLPPGYVDPKPSGGYDDYYRAASLPENETGWASNKVGRVGDPTIGNAVTGSQSIILGSRNINFTLPILSWGGRAGLGVTLALSYNSIVWIKDPLSGKLAFNLDKGFPSPGWRLGFGQLLGGTPSGGASVIPPIWHIDLGRYVYFWVEPEGTRRMLVGGTTEDTDPYVSNDSSQIEYNKQTGLLRLRDGTQIKFTTPTDALGQAVGNEMLPAEIKDRNGNYLTITNQDTGGRWTITNITDTLGRVIEFRYEDGFLTEVGQQRDSEWHSFVKLYYAPITIQTIFSGVAIDPPNINGQQVMEPWFVEFPNQKNYRFFYTSYCQAHQIEKWVPDIPEQGLGHCVAYTWYDLPSVGGQSQPVGAIKPAANDDTPQTECPKFATRVDWAESFNLDGNGQSQEGSHLYTITNNADGTKSGKIVDSLCRVYRTDVSADQLTHTSRVWTDEASYGSDANPGPPLKTATTVYQSFSDGPQPVSITIADENGAKKTGLSYETGSGVTLLSEVTEYSDGGATVYRRTKTLYNTDPAYSSRHILGLPEQALVYRGASETDIILPGGGSRAARRVKYDKTGLPTEVYDAADNVTRLYYDDNFNNKPVAIGDTHALLTRAQDPDGYWSGAQYNWHIGLPVESYHIAGTSGDGAHENVVTYGYDFADRVAAINRPTSGNTTYDYWDNWLAVGEFTQLDAAQRHYLFTADAGAGQLKWHGGDHADAGSGKYWIRKFEYDAAARATRIYNVTAVDGNLDPIDDDDPANGGYGYLYTTIEYDALDRQTLITRPDGNTAGYEYDGCGCAGGWTVTARDERGKQRRQIFDFLGRLCRAQELNTDQVNPVFYNQARHIYDERDLLLRIEHSDGDENNHQDRTFAYDGYGRLQSQMTPEGGTVNYTYKPNDLVETVTDERGIVVSYNYNQRGLLTQALYSDATPDAFYDYGEYGERLWMQEKNSDGEEVARTDYGYDPYKRLQSETRRFNELAGTFKVEYEYNYVDLPVTLRYTVNGWVRQVKYAYSQAGALKSAGTDLTAGDSTNNIASSLLYRGFGAVKQMGYGNGQQLQAGYSHHRHHLTSMAVKKPGGADPAYDLSYDYYGGGASNGRAQKITDNLDGNYTTTYEYDDYNRLDKAYGVAFYRDYDYDAWGNLTNVYATGAGETGSYTLSYEQLNGAPKNNQISNAGFSYDLAGNMTSDGVAGYN
jgi:YD repeat-containing protein